MWDLWCTVWHWDRFLNKYFDFPCPYQRTVYVEIVVDKMTLGQAFLTIFLLFLVIIIPTNAPY